MFECITIQVLITAKITENTVISTYKICFQNFHYFSELFSLFYTFLKKKCTHFLHISLKIYFHIIFLKKIPSFLTKFIKRIVLYITDDQFLDLPIIRF